MKYLAISLIFLLCFGVDTVVYAEMDKEKFDTIAKKDAMTAIEQCKKLAYDKNKVDLVYSRAEARGLIITRTQAQVILYSACMSKVYDNDVTRMLQSLPTDGA